ncbi:MAG: hypothetical protein O3C21_16860 [Verrucomicrobia bacterium]|nr:hypothetical protein [Verrucomicrobiota bacterium]
MKQACLDKGEAEANYGAGQLLFPRERFTAEALSSAPTGGTREVARHNVQEYKRQDAMALGGNGWT